jgi:hypothetical protein
MPAPLHFREDGSFTIVQFTDTHWQNGELPDLRTAQLMADVLDAERPDLVVLTGDVIFGSGCKDPLQSWTGAVMPIIERNLPWAAVFGNHDGEGSATREQLMTHQQTLPGCLSVPGPTNISGIGNYILPIANRPQTPKTGTDPVFDKRLPGIGLYLLDSHAYVNRARKEYAWIEQDQIDWFAKTSAELAVPSLVFFHIPLPEYNDVWNAGGCEGSKYESVCCPKTNSGFFSALKASGNVLGTFCGHDHVNDFCGELGGVRLCYGRATGFNTYGGRGFQHGARAIVLREGVRGFKTHVRLNANDELLI